jgi:hypothetical protein
MERTINNTNNSNSNFNPQSQSPPTNRIKSITLRSSIISVGLIGIILNSIYGYALPNTKVECIVDNSMNFTSNINNYFAQNIQSKFLLLILLNLCVDLTMILLGLRWILHGKSWRVFITLVTFYFSKIFMSFIFQEKTPVGYLWEYPGFPSLMVSYLNSENLFFSTATGFLTIASLEFFKTENFYLFAFSFCVLLLDVFTRNVLRANYIIDLICAVVVAHFIFLLVDELCNAYLDNSKSEWLNLKKKEDDEKVLEIGIDASEGYITVKNNDIDREH